MSVQAIIDQVILALAYYAGLLLIMRLSGKRLAGQTTTFDLIVLISLGVVLQTMALNEGTLNAGVFVISVFTAHLALARACARSERLRILIRGGPRALVRRGKALHHALQEEGISYDELLAGLRKLGYQSEQEVELAVMEETGHISAIASTAKQ